MSLLHFPDGCTFWTHGRCLLMSFWLSIYMFTCCSLHFSLSHCCIYLFLYSCLEFPTKYELQRGWLFLLFVCTCPWNIFANFQWPVYDRIPQKPWQSLHHPMWVVCLKYIFWICSLSRCTHSKNMYFKQNSLKWEGAPRSPQREPRWCRSGRPEEHCWLSWAVRGLLTGGQFSVAPEGVLCPLRACFTGLTVCGLLSDCQLWYCWSVKPVILTGQALLMSTESLTNHWATRPHCEEMDPTGPQPAAKKLKLWLSSSAVLLTKFTIVFQLLT